MKKNYMTKIYYRKNINMPRGKLIAQCSHALSSFLLGCFDFNQLKFKTTDIDLFMDAILSTTLIPLEDDEFYKISHDFLILIEDNGRTVFNGEKTITCGLLIDLSLKNKLLYEKNRNFQEEQKLNTRLIQIIDKNFAKIDFNRTIHLSVIQQSLHLLQLMQQKNFCSTQEFLEWTQGSFTKITLISHDNFLDLLKDNLSKVNLLTDKIDNQPITWNEKSCVIGPVSKEKIDFLTKNLKMM